MATLDQLVQHIRNHGHEAKLSSLEQYIIAKDTWTWRDDTGAVRQAEEWVKVEPTVDAVQEWLGY